MNASEYKKTRLVSFCPSSAFARSTLARRSLPLLPVTRAKPTKNNAETSTETSSTPHKRPLKAFPYLHAHPEKIHKLQGAHKAPALVALSSYILSSALQLSEGASTAGASPLWVPILAGGALGAAYVALNRAGVNHIWREPTSALNVVITGGTKGIGKALAREFLRSGDRVIVASRSQRGASEAAAQLAREAGVPESFAVGIVCDVADAASVAALGEAAVAQLGTVDVWVNNAGYSGSFQPFIEQNHETIERVVRTNLLGSLLCTKTAVGIMGAQPTGGHIFNAEGAGSNGMATPNYAAYGATKAAISQLCTTMQKEATMVQPVGSENGQGPRIGVHNISPGMVLTDLLLEGATLENKRAFDILCEHPETVAAFLVPRMRTAVARKTSGQRIRYLTPARALARFATAPMRLGRFFDAEGNPVYPSEEERLNGQHAKRTERLAAQAARRNIGLGLAYSASIAAAYFILAVDAMAKVHGN